MCLYSVEETYNPSLSGTGYKIMYKVEKDGQTEYFGYFRHNPCNIGVEIENPDKNEYINKEWTFYPRFETLAARPPSYRAGFHILLCSLEEAINTYHFANAMSGTLASVHEHKIVLMEVEYSNGHTIGTDMTLGAKYKCVVADTMKLIKEVEIKETEVCA